MQIMRFRGDTRPDTCTITTVGTQDATNISGCSFLLTISTAQNPIDTSTQLYQINGAIVDAINGVVEFSPTLSQADRVGFFYYDIQMTDTYGNIHTLCKGAYVYQQDITK
jgi:hypothetical protein